MRASCSSAFWINVSRCVPSISASGVSTNINVYTNLRSYYFNVVEGGGPTYYVVRYRFDAELKALAGELGSAGHGVSGEVEARLQHTLAG